MYSNSPISMITNNVFRKSLLKLMKRGITLAYNMLASLSGRILRICSSSLPGLSKEKSNSYPFHSLNFLYLIAAISFKKNPHLKGNGAFLPCQLLQIEERTFYGSFIRSTIQAGREYLCD